MSPRPFLNTRSVLIVDVKATVHRVVHSASKRTTHHEIIREKNGADPFTETERIAAWTRSAVRLFFSKLIDTCTRIPSLGDENNRLTFNVHKPILCFDQHGGQRRPLIESYKEGRKEELETVTRSLEGIRTVAEDAGLLVFPTCRDLVVEADDLIDTAVRVLHEQDPEGYRIVMSVDKDLLACLRHGDGYNTCVLRPHKNVWVSNKNAEKELGVPPHRVSEFLAMNGDASDGIPPIPAISGARRAADMLSVYPDLYELANSQFLRGNALRTLIMNYSLTVPHNVPDVVARLDSSPNVYDSINFLRVKRISEALRKRFGSHSWNTSERKLCRLLESRTARAQGRCKKVLETKENRDPTADPTSSHAIVEDV